MGLKLDRFTWIVTAIVALLLVAAVVTVNLSRGAGWGNDTYQTDNSPATPVYNAFVAFQKGDVIKARDQYSKSVLDEIQANKGYDPFYNRVNNLNAQRLRILQVDTDPAHPDHAVVTFVEDNYSNQGLFNSGSSWSRRGNVEVVREAGVWKIDTQEFFY